MEAIVFVLIVCLECVMSLPGKISWNENFDYSIFYRAAWNAMRILSVRQSVKRVHCDKTEERSVRIFIPYQRSFSLVFWGEEWLVGGDPLYQNFGSTGRRCSEIADFEPIFACSASAVTLAKKVQLALIGSPLRRGAGTTAPAALVVRGCTGAEKCPFLQDNS